MPKLTGLFRRKNTWHCRIWIPCDLHRYYGRRELKRSLKTSDYKTAVERLKRLHDDVEQEFTNARARPNNGVPDWSKLFQKSVPVHGEMNSILPLDSTSNVSTTVRNYGDIDIIVEKVVERVLTSLGHQPYDHHRAI
jgi:hypothetical protein